MVLRQQSITKGNANIDLRFSVNVAMINRFKHIRSIASNASDQKSYSMPTSNQLWHGSII